MSSNLASLPPLREVIATFGLSARKSLGQNFLFDLNLTRRIARSGGPLNDGIVVEVGPGPGGLTRSLLLEGAETVLAIERDERCLPALEDIAAAAPDRLQIIQADALKIDFGTLTNQRPYRIVANLPYNVATPLLVGWLSSPEPILWKSMTLMFQREVAERIVAGAGDKHYGRLAVLSSWKSKAVRLFDIPPEAFSPKPKVTSSLVRFEPRADAADVPVAAVERVTAAAFGQRRKMLRSSLKSLWPDPEAVLNAVGIDPRVRAETVPVAGFIALAERLEIETRRNAGSNETKEV